MNTILGGNSFENDHEYTKATQKHVPNSFLFHEVEENTRQSRKERL